MIKVTKKMISINKILFFSHVTMKLEYFAICTNIIHYSEYYGFIVLMDTLIVTIFILTIIIEMMINLS